MDWIWVLVGIVVACYVVASVLTKLFVREEPTRREYVQDARDDDDVLVIELMDD